MELVVVQGIIILLLFVGTLIFGTIPIFIVRRAIRNKHAHTSIAHNNNRSDLSHVNRVQTSGKDGHLTVPLFLPFLMCVGGGVLLATCFLHLIPEVKESFELTTSASFTGDVSIKCKTICNMTGVADEDGGTEASPLPHGNHGIPWPELVICFGFFLVYFVEEVAHCVIGHKHCVSNSDTHTSDASAAKVTETCHNHDNSHMKVNLDGPEPNPSTPLLLECENDENGVLLGAGDKNCKAHYGATSQSALSSPYPSTSRVQKLKQTHAHTPNPLHLESGHSHCIVTTSHDSSSSLRHQIRGLLIVLALSFHSVFEGLATGLQPTVEKIWTLFFAVALHKYVIAFVVGLELVVHGSSACRIFAYMFVFSIMSPIGMGVAMITENVIESANKTDVPNTVVGVLSALATGSILYVTFFEVLQREQNTHLPGLIQLLAIIIGFGLMFVILFATVF